MAGSLRDSVTHYLDHLQDAGWVEALVREHGLDEVLSACVEALDAPGVVNHVTTLVRDLGIAGIVDHQLSAKARERIPAMVLPALRPLLRAPIVEVRIAALFTIGKLSFPAEARTLREVFPWYLERDPFCLARLLGELQWLGDRRGVHARLDRIIAHPSYLVRWSALGHLHCTGASSSAERRTRSRWLAALSADPAPLVAAEASHQLARLEYEVAGARAHWLPKAEWRKKRRALDGAEPEITFSTLEIRFLSELAGRAQADYGLDELDAFVLTCAADGW